MGCPDNIFLLFRFSHQRTMYLTEGRTILPREAIGPNGSIASRRGSVPVFLRKPIAIFNFPGGRVRSPVPPSGYTRGTKFVFRVRNDVVFQHNNVYNLVKKMRCYQDVYGGWA